jgi:hypothetical protein
MEHKENSFTILKKHESPMESSIHGKMTEVLQLCQNNSNKAHYFTYEVLDNEGAIIGGRLIYEFKNPNKALEEWDNYINENLKPSDDFKVTKQELFSNKKLRF